MAGSGKLYFPSVQPGCLLRIHPQILPSLNGDFEPLLTGLTLPGTDLPVLVLQSTIYAHSETGALAKAKPLIDTHPAGAIQSIDCDDTTQMAEYAIQEALSAKGPRYLADNVYIKQDANLVDICRKAFTDRPHKGGMAYWEPMSPTSRKPLPGMALSMHSDHYVAVYAVYNDPAEDDFQRKWVAEYIRDLEPYAVGAYLGDADFQVRPTKFWSTEVELEGRQFTCINCFKLR